ncbi:MAG: tRNA lysidine(34) synthetase TilS [bacterium]|nr:tRNA lysidine(34) synthetase TilS [bacterium]
MSSINHTLTKQVLGTIKKYNLIRKNDRILIGLSGGADSLALFLILNGLKEEFNLSLVIAHLNHRIRGRESDGDEIFVRSIGKRFGIPVITRRINIPLLRKKRKKQSLEEIAHQERMHFFQDILGRRSLHKIALAHHLDDSVENYFLSTFQAGSLNSLSGMKPAEGNIIRPLILCRKKEILEFVRSSGWTPRQDRTNQENRIPRNWIRNILLPFIGKQFRPVESNMARLMDILYHENELMNSIRDVFLSSCKYSENFYAAFLKLASPPHVSIIRRLVREILIRMGQPYNYYLIDRISRFIPGGETCLELNDLYVWKHRSCLLFTLKKRVSSYRFEIKPAHKPVFIKDLGLTVNCSEIRPPVKKWEENCLYLDKTRVHKIIIRNKKNRDYIILLNTDYRVQLKKLLTDLKIPEPLKQMVPVLETNGETAGIFLDLFPVHGKNKVSEKYKITAQTKKILKLEFTQAL